MTRTLVHLCIPFLVLVYPQVIDSKGVDLGAAYIIIYSRDELMPAPRFIPPIWTDSEVCGPYYGYKAVMLYEDHETMTVEHMIDNLIEREGGYVNHPADSGGPTNYGITQKTLGLYRGKAVTAEDVRDLDIYEARRIYYENYWIKPGFTSLSLGFVNNEILFDTAVHQGPKSAVKMLQRAVGVMPDGILGPVTRASVLGWDEKILAAKMISVRLKTIGRLVTRKPSQAVFAAGWCKRLSEFVELIPKA